MTNPQLEITGLISPLINSFKLLNNEWKHLFELGIEDYIQSQTEKYYFTNTFIHRSEKVRFDDIYYPLKARYHKLETDFSNLTETLDNYRNITLIGSAGSGKTTLIKYIFLTAIRNTKKIPIIIELRFLNDFNGDFEKLIIEKILNSGIEPTEGTLKRALRSGKFIFLLDGYDEIFSSKKQELNRQIGSFVDSYSKNNFIITTRPGSGIERFPRFNDFNVSSLTIEDVEAFILKIVTEGERSKRILSIVKEEKNSNYLEYLKNPLLLSMFILAFESHPEIPSRKSSFYRNVFDTLYSKHDGITKNSFPREKKTKFEREEFEDILSVFSYLTITNGQYSFTNEILTDKLRQSLQVRSLKCNVEDLIYDLQTTISILILDGLEYSFPHRSMQEYFTSMFVSNLSTEQKEVAYKKLFNLFVKASTDNSFNLWNLSSELDSTAFTKHFLIPQLQNYSNILKIDNEKKLLLQYFEIIEPKLYYDFFSNENNGKKEMVILCHQNFHTSLIDFTETYDYSLFAYFTDKPKVKEQLIKLFNPIKKEVKAIDLDEIEIEDEIGIVQNRLYEVEDERVIQILLENNICDVIHGFRKAILDKIKQLKSQIKTDESNIDTLLNL